MNHLHDWTNEVRPLSLRANLELRDFGEELILEAVVPNGGRHVEPRQSRTLLSYNVCHIPISLTFPCYVLAFHVP